MQKDANLNSIEWVAEHVSLELESTHEAHVCRKASDLGSVRTGLNTVPHMSRTEFN